MNRIVSASLSMLLAAATLFLSACNGGASGSGSATNSALNLAGTWTVKTVSTQGHGTSSGTATVTQSGQGLGVNGTTTLSAPIGQIVLSQTGTALTGSITYEMQTTTYNYTGTLSSGNLTITGSASCSATTSQSTSFTGTITSNAIQGTYTITRGSGCYYPSDAGTFVATKQ
jgi:hypothetical protein